MTGPTDYDTIATRYASGIDDRPRNALYERPATLWLLPGVAGMDVLDAGCGPGWYARMSAPAPQGGLKSRTSRAASRRVWVSVGRDFSNREIAINMIEVTITHPRFRGDPNN